MKRLVVALAVVFAGCSGGGSDSVECRIVSLQADQLVSGETAVEVGFEGPVSRVELLVAGSVVATAEVAGGSSASLTWDTVATADGTAEVTARVEGSGAEHVSEPVSVVVDNTPPVVSIYTARLAQLQGTVEVPISVQEANLASIRLLANGVEVLGSETAESPLAWDTTQVDSRVQRLVLEATDAAGHTATSEEVPVIVTNGGEEIRVRFDPSAWVIIPDPYDPAAETDTRISAPMDERPVMRVISWLTWDGAEDWDLEYAIGQGICPHRGVKYLDEESDSGEIVLELDWVEVDPDLQDDIMSFDPDHPEGANYFPYNGDPATCGTFFGHVRDMGAADHAGQRLQIDVHFVYIYAGE